MVKISAEDKKAIHQAVLAAEQQTNAELAVVVAPASDAYGDVILPCGLAFGATLALVLWYERLVLAVPLLICTQLAVMLLWSVIPFLRHLSLKLVPKHVLHHRAAQRAAAEYVHAAHHLPAGVPFVLLYVSLAERYVHIYSSREVRKKIPDAEWNAVVRTLTDAIQGEGMKQAVMKAVEHAAGMLKDHFPRSERGL